MVNQQNARALNGKDLQTATKDSTYTDRLVGKELVWWKRWIDVQAPYRWNLERLNLGRVLEVGCGIGRNLRNLRGRGVGVDHNAESVEVARQRGYEAYETNDFLARPKQLFDSLLIAHVLEHCSDEECVELINTYLPYIRPGGCVVMITPQEVGYRSDPTHVQFFGYPQMNSLAESTGLAKVSQYSYPFPRIVGHLFIYNEFVGVYRK